jgi:hypothetical protein
LLWEARTSFRAKYGPRNPTRVSVG